MKIAGVCEFIQDACASRRVFFPGTLSEPSFPVHSRGLKFAIHRREPSYRSDFRDEVADDGFYNLARPSFIGCEGCTIVLVGLLIDQQLLLSEYSPFRKPSPTTIREGEYLYSPTPIIFTNRRDGL